MHFIKEMQYCIVGFPQLIVNNFLEATTVCICLIWLLNILQRTDWEEEEVKILKEGQPQGVVQTFKTAMVVQLKSCLFFKCTSSYLLLSGQLLKMGIFNIETKDSPQSALKSNLVNRWRVMCGVCVCLCVRDPFRIWSFKIFCSKSQSSEQGKWCYIKKHGYI